MRMNELDAVLLNKTYGSATCNGMLTPYLHADQTRRAAMVVVPGGGYGNCSPREKAPVAQKYYDAGYQVFVLEYSVAPITYPTQILELGSAVVWVKAHAEEYGIDPDRIAVIGFSAGGHLAAHYSCVSAQVAEMMGVQRKDTAIAACILCYPVITSGCFAHTKSFQNLCGGDEELAKELSCETLVHPEMPPTFLWHTLTDELVPVENSMLYAAALRRNGVKFELHIYDQGIHGMSVCEESVLRADKPGEAEAQNYVSAWIGASIAFLRDILGPAAG